MAGCLYGWLGHFYELEQKRLTRVKQSFMINGNMSAQQSILLTTTSFQDVLGNHHQLLEEQGYKLIRERGPLSEGTHARIGRRNRWDDLRG